MSIESNLKNPQTSSLHLKVKTMQCFGLFLNWLSGYFDLYQQDEDKGSLKVYLPEGEITISGSKTNKNEILIRITLHYRSLKSSTYLTKKLKEIWTLFSGIKEIKEVENSKY